MKDQKPEGPQVSVGKEDTETKAQADEFLKITKDTPPKQKKALEVFARYVKTLESLTPSQWKHFFTLIQGKEKPIEFAKDNDAVAKLHPADHAYWLMLRIRELDVAWWKRYGKRIAKAIAWLMGVPILGSIIDWLKENWDQLPFFSRGPTDIFQSEEYVFLILTGAWIAFLLETRKLR
jgi:hypothetical protein